MRNNFFIFLSLFLVAIMVMSVVFITSQTNLKPASENCCDVLADYNLMDYIYVENLPDYTWEFPIKDYLSRKISYYFGWRKHPIHNTLRMHTGIDLPGTPGEEIFAFGAGRVTRASWYAGYGRCIDITHEDGVVTRYAHLSRFSVKKGDVVTTGQVIGLMGSSGLSSSTHLHFEVRLDDKCVDPENYMLNKTEAGGR